MDEIDLYVDVEFAYRFRPLGRLLTAEVEGANDGETVEIEIVDSKAALQAVRLQMDAKANDYPDVPGVQID